MQSISRIAAIVLGIAMASPLPAHGPAKSAAGDAALAPDAAAAAATVDAFHAALRRRDTAAAAALLAEDALVFEAGGAERSKAEYAASHLAADAEFAAAVPATLVRRTGGTAGGLAWIASEGRVSGQFKGKSLDRITTETMLLRRAADGWKIVHVHWSSGAGRAD
jgi:ketosteroid isomerase-like protein